MNICLISPYHSGSHKAWADGYAKHSQHEVTLLTLPGRFWKWRMHGGAVTLARQFLAQYDQSNKPDLIIIDDMCDLTTFLALTRTLTHEIKTMLYMHENQLTYPLHNDKSKGAMRRQHGERDRHYIFVNYASMMAADHIFFNSAYHLNAWFTALPNFLKHFPDFNELDSIETLQNKSAVLPIGISLPPSSLTPQTSYVPLILWNQRWEYDKNPEGFFTALQAIDDLQFRVAVCGENFSRQPTIFDEARASLGDRVLHWGYAESAQYRALLDAADIVISTAHHEFFGISIVEAVAHGAFPLLPNRLSYPEIIPAPFHAACLYEGAADLHTRLRTIIQNGQLTTPPTLIKAMQRYDWSHLAPVYDQTFQDQENNKW